MNQFCTFCHKRINTPAHHTHGTIVSMTKNDFIKFEQDQFLQKMQQNGFILCTPNGFGTMTFFCPWCRVEHRHGITEEGSRHRVAHCSSFPGSPFQKRGYYIKSKDETGLDSFIPEPKGLDEFFW